MYHMPLPNDQIDGTGTKQTAARRSLPPGCCLHIFYGLFLPPLPVSPLPGSPFPTGPPEPPIPLLMTVDAVAVDRAAPSTSTL